MKSFKIYLFSDVVTHTEKKKAGGGRGRGKKWKREKEKKERKKKSKRNESLFISGNVDILKTMYFFLLRTLSKASKSGPTKVSPEARFHSVSLLQ